jgi:hypothetical protein
VITNEIPVPKKFFIHGHGSGLMSEQVKKTDPSLVFNESALSTQTNDYKKRGKKMTQINYFRSVWIILTGLVFLTLFILPVTAQENQPLGSEPVTEITDTDLNNAALAYTQIQFIHQEFQQAVQQTQDQTERQQLQDKANARLVNAIKESGLDVETYNHIMAQVQSDEQLKKSFIEKIQTTQ